MLIQLREKAGRKFYIPLPYSFLINISIRKTWLRWGLYASRHENEEQLEKYEKYLNEIDFGELRSALKILGDIRGLTLLEVESSDGTYIKINS